MSTLPAVTRVVLSMGVSVLFLVEAAQVFAIQTNLVISVYQGHCNEGDFSANLSTAREVIQQARDRGSQFLALPECFLSGYESREVVERGARSLEDPALQEFIRESDTHDMVVLTGLARKAGSRLYNTELVIYRGKLLGWYDKIMLTGGDRDTLGFQPGTSMPVFQAHGVRFAVIICHDSSFPHAAMDARLQGAEILFTPHYNEIGVGTVDDHRRSVRDCHIGLATQLKMVVARANVVKADRAGQVGYGDSFILSPQGTPLAEANLFKTELITATVTPAMFKSPWVFADANEVPAWLRTQLARLLTEFRRPTNDADLHFWLEDMVVFHRFTPGEVSVATGLTLNEVHSAIQKFDLAGKSPPPRTSTEPLRLLPYPGGRHPRIGFLDGAIAPQRETKFSVFTPWDPTAYVVVDVPEAIFSNLGLTYLAHTHIPTIWDTQGITLPRLEWQRLEDGSLASERVLPNGIVFGARVIPSPTQVRMRLWLRNGTSDKLTGLRVQNCAMLSGAPGFIAQTLTNKVFQSPYAAARSEDGRHWIIMAWDPVHRCWGNEQCPCLHSDPQFPDCPPGQTVHVRGWLSFYEGVDVKDELERIDQTGWRKAE
jgi:predicted amidohydrolase